MAKPSKISKGDIRRISGYIRNYRLHLALSIILSALIVAMTLYVPVLIGSAIDLVAENGLSDISGITDILIRTGVIVAITAVIQWISNTVNNHITFHIVRDMRNEAFSKLQKYPLSYTDTHPTGETVSRIIADADQFGDGLLMGFTQFFTGIVTILGTLFFMLKINWRIALIVVVMTPLSLFIAKFIASKTYSMFKLQSETRGEQTAFIDEMITNSKVVSAFGREKENLARFDEINGRLEKCSLRATFFSSLTNPSTRFVNNVIYAVVALAGAVTCIGTRDAAVPFTVGSLTCLLSYANQYTKPFNEISGVVTELQNSLACAGRLFELMEVSPEAPDSEDVLENASGNIEIKDVSFSYTPEKPLIRGLDLSVRQGQRVAIVGPTGCGKTTLINLLMRFYDPDSGSITIDGKDIAKVSRHSLRHNLGMVLQDTWLKSGTIRDNIIIGKPDATEEEILQAARQSHAHNFIKRLPEGYDTFIGEDGGSLSQGQKQLLCITRLMLSTPPVLILDEATSSIDTRTEVKIQRAFDRLMKGRTSFVVAHRLSTIMDSDIILVMKDGNIIEQGTHRELLEKNGFYTELYNSQFAT